MAPRKKDKPAETDKAAEEKRLLQEQDDYLEEALEETFPASDPIAPGHVNGKKR